MIWAILLFVTPVLLFVLAFLYETYISFKRLYKKNYKRTDYVSATWEVTHTLLVFAVVMLVMLFTQVLDELAATIFLPTFLAALTLMVRSSCYTYIFYVRKKQVIGWVDWLFAVSHVVAAGLLVVTVLKALWFIYKENPAVNEQFVPLFIPGLIFVLAVCSLPLLILYKTKN